MVMSLDARNFAAGSLEVRRMSGEMLLYGGIAIMLFAAVGAVAAIIILRLRGKSLQQQLIAEYGEKRH
jgi:hypothetical protein